MSTAFAAIGIALDSRLNTLASSPPVAWENTLYTPVSGTTYLRPTNLIGATAQASLGDTGLDKYQGIYQIDVFAPLGDGPGAANAQADLVADHFSRGTDLTSGAVVVRLGDVSRVTGTKDGDRYLIAVSINYMAYIAPR